MEKDNFVTQDQLKSGEYDSPKTNLSVFIDMKGKKR